MSRSVLLFLLIATFWQPKASLGQPVIDSLEPADNAITSNNSPTFRATYHDSVNGVDATSQQGALDFWTSITFTGNTSESTATPSSPLSDGNHYITFSIADTLGNRSADVTHQFIVDTVAPSITSVDPPDSGEVHTLVVPLAVYFSDATTTVDTVNATVDSVPISMTLGYGSATGTKVVSAGVHDYSVSVRDQAGHWTTVSTTFTAIAPTPAIEVTAVDPISISPAFNPYTVTHHDVVTVSYTVTEPMTGTMGIYTRDGNPVRTISLPASVPGTVHTVQWDGIGGDGQLPHTGIYGIFLFGLTGASDNVTSTQNAVRIHY